MSIDNESPQQEEIEASADIAQDDPDEETSSEGSFFEFDEKEKHFPMFFLTDPPYGVRLSIRSEGILLYILIRTESM